MYARSLKLILCLLLVCSTVFGQSRYPLPATGGATAIAQSYWTGTTAQRTGLTAMAEGDQYFDTDTSLLYVYLNSAWTARLVAANTVLFKQTADGTCGNTGVETAITSTGVGSLTLPANFWTVGKTVRIMARGYHKETSGSTYQYLLKTTDSTPTTVTLWDSSSTGTNSITSNQGWEAEWIIVCRSTGASGTVLCNGRSYRHFTSRVTALNGNLNSAFPAVTLDTTKTQTISLTCTWGTGAVGRTTTLQYFTIEALN